MNVDWPDLIRKLSEPFPPSDLKWRAGSVSRDKQRAQALPYVDARVCEDRLNALCPGGWQVTFKPWGEHRVICELTLHGVTRSSTGESERNPEGIKGTAAEAQAFKRACSRFGLGRYLYDLPAPWVAYDAVRKQLAELPKLPTITQARRSEALPARGTPPAAESLPTLSRERAHAMHRELGKLGLKPDAQYALASRILEREVKSFTTLSESEALQVWNAAKRQALSSTGRPSSTNHLRVERFGVGDAEASAFLG